MSNNSSSGKSFQVKTYHSTTLPESHLHPQYHYWKDQWQTLRDCTLGERAVKEKSTAYLPKMRGQTEDEEYTSFLQRATFFNMVGRTVNGLVGTIFQKAPKIDNLPPKMEDSVKNITRDNKNIADFTKLIAQEVVTVGRYGVLLDMPRGPSVEPYMVGYITENIINWRVVEGFDGREEVVEIVLREFEDRSDSSEPNRNRLVPLYRVLRLEWVDLNENSLEEGIAPDIRRVYKQYTYRSTLEQNAGTGTTYANPDLNGIPSSEVMPTRSGEPFDFIPFVFFGPWSNDPDTDKPPLLDIADLNLSHYRSYAQLEHGRFYTAMPIFYNHIKPGDEGGDYYIGPNTVWEVTGDKSPGIMEFNGHGLIFLEKALDQKEQQISSLGGRMLGVRTNAVAESDNTVALKEKNERSLLLNITNCINNGATSLVRWYAEWMDVPASLVAKIEVQLNQDFLLDTMSAREFRAITMMYQDGVLPVSVLYSYFQKAEVIPHDVSEDEFVTWLEDPKQFPNQVDVQAQMRGFSDANSELEQKNRKEDIKRQDKMMAQNAQQTQDPALNDGSNENGSV